MHFSIIQNFRYQAFKWFLFILSLYLRFLAAKWAPWRFLRPPINLSGIWFVQLTTIWQVWQIQWWWCCWFFLHKWWLQHRMMGQSTHALAGQCLLKDLGGPSRTSWSTCLWSIFVCVAGWPSGCLGAGACRVYLVDRSGLHISTFLGRALVMLLEATFLRVKCKSEVVYEWFAETRLSGGRASTWQHNAVLANVSAGLQTAFANLGRCDPPARYQWFNPQRVSRSCSPFCKVRLLNMNIIEAPVTSPRKIILAFCIASNPLWGPSVAMIRPCCIFRSLWV